MKPKPKTPTSKTLAELKRLRAKLSNGKQPPVSEGEAIRRLRVTESRRAELRLKREEGKLIDADAVRITVTERATAEREALLNWPARIAPDLAAKFGVTERDMFVALDGAVRQHLSERSQQPVT